MEPRRGNRYSADTATPQNVGYPQLAIHTASSKIVSRYPTESNRSNDRVYMPMTLLLISINPTRGKRTGRECVSTELPTYATANWSILTGVKQSSLVGTAIVTCPLYASCNRMLGHTNRRLTATLPTGGSYQVATAGSNVLPCCVPAHVLTGRRDIPTGD